MNLTKKGQRVYWQHADKSAFGVVMARSADVALLQTDSDGLVDAPVAELHALVTRAAPAWAWDTIDDTLSLDAKSSAFDPSVRAEIQAAIDAIDLRGTR